MIKKVALKELGANFPIGAPASLAIPSSSEKIIRPFSFQIWNMEKEREIGSARSEELTVGLYVSKIIAIMLDTIGGADIKLKDKAERALLVNQMFMADVLYSYIWLRYESLGKELEMVVQCPACRRKFNIIADLETLEVSVHEDEDTLFKDIELQMGFQYKGSLVKNITLTPAKWELMEALKPEDAMNEGAMAHEMFIRTIAKIEGEAVDLRVDSSALSTLRKADINKIQEEMVKLNAGPNMVLECRCTHCRTLVYQPIRWEYDNFF